MIGVIGLGVVGQAVFSAFGSKLPTTGFDKFGIFADNEYFEKILQTDIVFVCVPTLTIDGSQDQTPLHDVSIKLSRAGYKGVVCVKCTVTPGTMKALAEKYTNLRFAHNPEFLTAAKPFEDFMQQKEIIISGDYPDSHPVYEAYRALFPDTPIRRYGDFYVTEIAKYYSNCFLAVKVTFANEMYELCKKLNCSYDDVRVATLSQGLIAPNHTVVPGPDGSTGFGGACFPKDVQALHTYCAELGLPQEVLAAAIEGNKRRRTFDNACKEVGVAPLKIM